MQTIIFDIETGPLPEADLEAMLPPFDPEAVKTGNLGPEKAVAKIAEAQANHRANFFRDAALDALTGRVLAVGLLFPHNGATTIAGDGNEDGILSYFWNICRADMGRLNEMIGFNSHLFDLPFLIRRSWKHGIQVPEGVRSGRFWSSEMVDLREWWQMGDRQAHGSLDSIARHLGVGAKTGNGADFAGLWATDRAKAEEYLRNDLQLTLKIAKAMGIV